MIVGEAVISAAPEIGQREIFEARERRRQSAAAFAVLAMAFAVLPGCSRPIHDRSTLRAIEAESRILMATDPTSSHAVPKSRWPLHIASLGPARVTIDPSGVDILVKPYFDGGWGYFVPRNRREPPEPAGRFSALGQGVYWYRPD
jgi:hypothetical protein